MGGNRVPKGGVAHDAVVNTKLGAVFKEIRA